VTKGGREFRDRFGRTKKVAELSGDPAIPKTSQLESRDMIRSIDTAHQYSMSLPV